MADESEECIILEVNREPLFWAEENVERYLIDPDAFNTAPPEKLYLAEQVETVVQSPYLILQHKRRESVFFYCARPGQWTDAKGKPRAVGSNHTLLAMATLEPEVCEIVILDWFLLFEDRVRPGFPVDWAEKFGDIQWERPS